MYNRAHPQYLCCPERAQQAGRGSCPRRTLHKQWPQHCGGQTSSTPSLRPPSCPGTEDFSLEASILSPINGCLPSSSAGGFPLCPIEQESRRHLPRCILSHAPPRSPLGGKAGHFGTLHHLFTYCPLKKEDLVQISEV